MLDAEVSERIKEAGLLHMSGDDYLTPELIEDAIDGTIEVHNNIDLASLKNQIKGDNNTSNGSPQ